LKIHDVIPIIWIDKFQNCILWPVPRFGFLCALVDHDPESREVNGTSLCFENIQAIAFVTRESTMWWSGGRILFYLSRIPKW
jgi:hypothetical protein